MPMPMLQVKSWERFQHYKHRSPPWIKLHFEILVSPDWVMLADDSKLLAVVCMLLASRNEGKVPADPDYIKRVAHLEKAPDFAPLIDAGFLMPDEECKRMLASASAIAQANAIQSRGRVETEESREEIPPLTPPKGEQVKKKNQIPADVRPVIEAFQVVAPKTRGGASLYKPIRARLKTGYTTEQLVLVIQRAQEDEWHRDTGKCLDLPYLMQERTVIRFVNDKPPPLPTQNAGHGYHRQQEGKDYEKFDWEG